MTIWKSIYKPNCKVTAVQAQRMDYDGRPLFIGRCIASTGQISMHTYSEP